MNDDNITLSEIIDGYYRGKINKGTMLRTLENLYGKNFPKIVTWADSYYYGLIDIEKILQTKRDIYKPEKTIKNDTKRITLLRKNVGNKIRNIEVVVVLFLTKNNIVKIDTQIFESKNDKIKSYWFSQIENYEDYLLESDSLFMRKIDGMLLDVKEERNEALILTSSEKPKIWKRFQNLDFD